MLRAMKRSLLVLATLALFGCGKKLPAAVQQEVDAQRAAAMKVAEDAAKVCPGAKDRAPFQANPMAGKLPPPNPAKGSALEADAKVVDVFVMCQWPDPRNPTTIAGTGLMSLKGTDQRMKLAVTMPEDRTETTCQKNGGDCYEVITPSRYVATPNSADLRIHKPQPDGGETDVTVVFSVP